MRIGNIEIGFPVVQAALSGYSDAAMRIIARRLGAPYTLCEVLLDQFVNTAGHSKKNQRRFIRLMLHSIYIDPTKVPIKSTLC